MGVRELRDVFHDGVKSAGVRCTAARMRYCDVDGVGIAHRDHHVIEFDIVHAGTNTAKTVTTTPVPPRVHPLHHVARLADKVIEDHKPA